MNKSQLFPKLFLTIMKITLQQLVICLVFCTFSYAHSAYSQFDLSKTVSLQMEKAEIKKVLSTIEKQVNVRFVYSSSNINTSQVVTINVNKKRLDQVLNELLLPLSVEYLVKENRIILRSNQEVGTIIPTPIVINSVNDPVVENNVSIDNTIKGTIIDEKGEKLPGVSISIKGTTRGTTTNSNGDYTISVQDNKATLVFSFVGYESQEVQVNNRIDISITLKVDIKSLEEVVVVGYGTVKKSDITGSVSSIKAQEINAFPVQNAMQSLNGRATGVHVVQNSGAPGGALSVKIRGGNSLQGSNEPLYVVDGFPLTGNINALNPADIESMEILKDASATAIYGSRGANGVVMITTKSGKSGKGIIDFETYYSTQEVIKKLELLNATEFATLMNERAVNDKVASPYFTQNQIAGFGEGIDWQNEIFRSAPLQNYSLTF